MSLISPTLSLSHFPPRNRTPAELPLSLADDSRTPIQIQAYQKLHRISLFNPVQGIAVIRSESPSPSRSFSSPATGMSSKLGIDTVHLSLPFLHLRVSLAVLSLMHPFICPGTTGVAGADLAVLPRRATSSLFVSRKKEAARYRFATLVGRELGLSPHCTAQIQPDPAHSFSFY